MPESKIDMQKILPLYIGQKCLFLLKGYGREGEPVNLSLETILQCKKDNGESEIVPILRQISSLTQGEMGEFINMAHKIKMDITKCSLSVFDGYPSIYYECEPIPNTQGGHLIEGQVILTSMTSFQLLYLTGIGVDLFGAIDSDLAIDAATLKQKEDK